MKLFAALVPAVCSQRAGDVPEEVSTMFDDFWVFTYTLEVKGSVLALGFLCNVKISRRSEIWYCMNADSTYLQWITDGLSYKVGLEVSI